MIYWIGTFNTDAEALCVRLTRKYTLYLWYTGMQRFRYSRWNWRKYRPWRITLEKLP